MKALQGHGDPGSQYLTVKLLHGDQVQGLERVSGGGDEVEAGVDPRVVVVEQGPLDLQLFLQVGFKLGVNVFHYGLVAGERRHREKQRIRAGTTQATDGHSGALYGTGQALL